MTKANLTRADEAYVGNAQQPGYRDDGGPGVRLSTVQFIDLGVPDAASATAVVNAVATSTTLPVVVEPAFGPLAAPRNLTVVSASASLVQVVTVEGEDAYGQPMAEQFTLNGTTPVVGVKAFRSVSRVTIPAGAAASTVSVGTGERLGLPFRLARTADVIGSLLVDNVVNANAVFVPGLALNTPATGTTTDVRGYVTPTGTLANGSRRFTFLQNVAALGDTASAFGLPQFRV